MQLQAYHYAVYFLHKLTNNNNPFTVELHDAS